MKNALLIILIFFTLNPFSQTTSFVTNIIIAGFCPFNCNVEIQSSNEKNKDVSLNILDTYCFLNDNNTNSFDELDD